MKRTWLALGVCGLAIALAAGAPVCSKIVRQIPTTSSFQLMVLGVCFLCLAEVLTWRRS